MPIPCDVVILSGVQGDTRRYRAFHLCEQLRLAGISCELEHMALTDLSLLSTNANIYILQRVPWNQHIAAFVEQTRSQGNIILADVDDLVFLQDSFQWIDSPDFVDPIRARLYQENLERNRITLEHCDGFIVSTAFLAEQLRSFGKPVWVHRNAFSLEMFARSNETLINRRSIEGKVIIGYASGTPTHDRDFAQVQPILKHLLEVYPHLHLHLIGHVHKAFEWGKVAHKVHYLKFVPWRDLPKLLAQLSVNIAPLRLDNPFSQSKSEVKYIEAALVKVPTVASPSDAFRYAIQPGHNGFLAASPEQWKTCLQELVEDPSLRMRIAENAYQDVLKRYSPWQRAEEAIQLLNAVSRQLKADAPSFPSLKIEPIIDPKSHVHLWVTGQVEKHPTLFERGLYTLKTRGMLTLFKEFWIFLRRTFAPWSFRRGKL